MAARVVVLTKEEEQAAALKLRDYSYKQLISAILVLGVLTAFPDCVPLVDEFVFVSLSGAVHVALFKKVLKDLGIL